MFFNLINVNSPTNFSGIDNGNQSAQNLADLNLTQRSEEPTQIQNTSAPEVKTESASLGVIDLEFKYPNYEVLDKKIVDDAILADFPYSGDIDKLKNCSDNWQLSNKFSDLVGNGLPEKFKIINEFGVKTDSGMVAYLFEKKNSDNGECRLVFGGTTSGENFGEFWQRNRNNTKTTITQWAANAKNMFNIIPHSYKDAYELLCKIIEKYPNDRFSTSGHSKGGAEASYAALKFNAEMVYKLKLKEEIFEAALRHEIKTKQGIATNLYKSNLRPEVDREQAQKIINDYKEKNLDKMVKSVNFSSAQLGYAVQQDIKNTFLRQKLDPETKKEIPLPFIDEHLINKNATQLISANISHYYIEGDYVPKLGDARNAKHYGDVKVLPNDNPTKTKLSEHADFAPRIEKIMGNGINKTA